jgi:hypothetical protein
MHITPNNKLASLGTIGLLFLAGIAGMVFLLPYSPAHAASPTVALSTISSGVQTAATSGTVGSALTITGDGFASGSPIEITTTYGTTTVTWLTASTPNTCGGHFSGLYGGIGNANSLFTGTTGSGTACLTTTATGMFETTLTVPSLPGGAQTIVVSDGVNSVSTAFTITPSITFAVAGGAKNFGFPEEALGASTFTLTGFGALETVTVATTAFTTTSFVSPATSAAGSVTFAASPIVADTNAGTKTITATGATSLLTASTTYTVNPWAAFYDSVGGPTTFSFIGAAPTSLVIEAHGLAATTIAANSITIGGVATSHAAVTPGTGGEITGVIVSPVATVPFGPVSVVIGGVTFNYAAGNIALGVGVWGGVLISSIAGSTTSTGVVSTDASSYKPGLPASGPSLTSSAPAQNQIGYFGYGFVPATSAGGFVSISVPTGLTYSSAPAFVAGNGGVGGASGAAKPDANGAIFATAGLGDTPWSLAGSPTTANIYAPIFSQLATKPANVLSPSFGITPWIDTSATSVIASAVDFTTSGVHYTAHGFGATDVLTATVGGGTLTTYPSDPSGTPGYCTAVNGACTTGAAKVPDLAGGPQNLVITGSITGTTVTATGAVTYDPAIVGSGALTGTTGCSVSPGTTCTLSIAAGVAGSTTIIRTGVGFGVHGLLANTEYDITWNGQTGTYYGFTSTATGGIPVPGVQITIPADTSGLHIIDIQKASTPGTSAIYANNLQGDYLDNDFQLGTSQNTQFGDMLFLEGTSLIATPTVTNVGGTAAITGNGLAANTLYDLGVSQAGVGTSSPASPSTCSLTGTLPASPPTTILGSFTSTSGGAVPSGVGVKITDTPTYPGSEQGTLYCVYAQTGGAFGGTTFTGVAEFELQASLGLNMSSAPVGHNVIVSAHGLASSTAYNILFNYQVSAAGIVSGTVVGAILSNSVGAGSATITIPNVPLGTYGVELQTVGKTTDAIASPPSITVGSVSSGSCNSTSCLTASTPAQSQQGSYTGVTSTFTNTSNAPVTAFVYAVVHNALGQTVDISTATVTASAGGSTTAFNALFGLAPGTYSVSIFATSSSGTAISGTSTVSVTIS